MRDPPTPFLGLAPYKTKAYNLCLGIRLLVVVVSCVHLQFFMCTLYVLVPLSHSFPTPELHPPYKSLPLSYQHG